jgi:hypothetical protein
MSACVSSKSQVPQTLPIYYYADFPSEGQHVYCYVSSSGLTFPVRLEANKNLLGVLGDGR